MVDWIELYLHVQQSNTVKVGIALVGIGILQAVGVSAPILQAITDILVGIGIVGLRVALLATESILPQK